MMRTTFLLAAILLASGAAAQTFTKETFTAGLGGVSRTNGVAVADYDRDGDLDVFIVVADAYVASNVQTWSRLFQNNGDGTFTDATLTSGLIARSSATEEETRGFKYEYSASWGDYDNDGYPDLFLGHLGPDQLFRNNGDGTFTDVTEAAGVASEGGGKTTVHGLWFDHDLDGDLDLYVSRWWDYGDERDSANVLYRNEGDGTFTDISDASGAAPDDGATWTTVAFDADHDGWLDLYVATDVDTTSGVGINRLLRNQGDGTYADVTPAFGLEDPNYGMGLAIADADRNGLLDLYLSNVATPSRFQRNPLWLQTAPGVYEDRAEAAGVDIAGWGWGTTFFDADSDGDEDLLVVTGLFDDAYPTYFFRSRVASGEIVFDSDASAAGLDDADAARGLVTFDYDGDGDQDVLVSNVFRAPYLYENHEPQGAWLQVELEGTVSNRDGLGAIVTAWVDGQRHMAYHHGSQYLAQNLTPVHLGLGAATVVDSLVVQWPSGMTDRATDVPIDRVVKMLEGTGLTSPTTTAPPPEASGAVEIESVAPNPARGTATVYVAVSEPVTLRFEIVDALGRRVHTRTTARGPGQHSLVWDSASLASGVYVARVSWDGGAVSRRIAVQR
ncbi:MAG: FG-GAP-like repeat-containing protein [Bacteroidota bacterium]